MWDMSQEGGMVQRQAKVLMTTDDQGHIALKVEGTLTNLEYIAAFEILKAKAVSRLADMSSPEVKISGRQIT